MNNILQVVVTNNKNSSSRMITGPERRALNTSNKWKKYNIDPIICYPKTGVLFSKFNENNKIIDFTVTNKFNFLKIIPIIKILKKYDIKLVHSQGAPSTDLIFTLAAKICSIPNIISRPVMISDNNHYSNFKKKNL